MSGGYTFSIWALAVLPDGRVASGSNDSTVPLRDLLTLHSFNPTVFRGRWGPVNAGVSLPDGHIASGSDDCIVRLWDPARPSDDPVVFEGHKGPIEVLAAVPDGRFVTRAFDGTVRLWDPALRRSTRVFVADAEVHCLAVVGDGLSVAGCEDGGVHSLRECDQHRRDAHATWFPAIHPTAATAPPCRSSL